MAQSISNVHAFFADNSEDYELSHTVAIYVPSTLDGDKSAAPDIVTHMVNLVSASFVEFFQGATSYNARGHWHSDNLGYVAENVVIVQSNCSADKLLEFSRAILTIAQTVRYVMRQECVTVSIDNRLYFV